MQEALQTWQLAERIRVKQKCWLEELQELDRCQNHIHPENVLLHLAYSQSQSLVNRRVRWLASAAEIEHHRFPLAKVAERIEESKK